MKCYRRGYAPSSASCISTQVASKADQAAQLRPEGQLPCLLAFIIDIKATAAGCSVCAAGECCPLVQEAMMRAGQQPAQPE